MKVQVKPLRQRGSRLTDQQIASSAPVEGHVSVYGVGTTIQISIYDGSANQQPLLPDLYDARLVTMQGAKMLFSGIQRTADPREAQYLQEWSVLILPIEPGDDGR
jgi:hypothetical protein